MLQDASKASLRKEAFTDVRTLSETEHTLSCGKYCSRVVESSWLPEVFEQLEWVTLEGYLLLQQMG